MNPRRDPKRPGTWYFVVELGRDPATGRRRQAFRRGYPTKKAAEDAAAKLKVSVTEQTFVAPAKQTVAEYLRGWLDAQTVRLRPSTLDGYRRNLEGYVIPRIGALKLDALTPAHLDRMYAQLLETGRRQREGGLSARSVRYIHTTLRKALADAVRKGLLVRNVADAADPPTAKASRAPEMAWWTPAQLRQFLAFTEHEQHGPLFRVTGMTGMRRGEVCGLRWSDVDLDKGTIRVRRQLLTTGTEHALYFQDLPKTDAGRRLIDLDPGTVTILRTQRARQSADKLAVGVGYRDTDLVFAQPDGTPVDPDSVAKVFERRVARSGLSRIRFHDLRHTHAAHLIEAGEQPLLISKRLGHTSVSFTLDRYGHLFDRAGSQAASKVGRMVDEG